MNPALMLVAEHVRIFDRIVTLSSVAAHSVTDRNIMDVPMQLL
jgi:hypothetical protein